MESTQADGNVFDDSVGFEQRVSSKSEKIT